MTHRAYYNEFDHKAAAWLRELIKAKLIMDGDVDERSIADVQPGDLRGYTRVHFFSGIGGWDYALRLAKWPDDRPVLTGSCPCQPFSAAGRKRGTHDVRHLWPHMFRIINSNRPETILGEQVAGAAGLGWLDGVIDDLESVGYTTRQATMEAAGIGAPHKRERIFFVANSQCKRQPQPGLLRPRQVHHAADAFREAARLVHAVRRGTLPYLCRSHDGLPRSLGRIACHGFGNAIVPQVAAEFIRAFVASIEANP